MDHSDSAPAGKKPRNTAGLRVGGGRPKGAPNKINGELKQMILDALDGAGGVDYLLKRANDPKTQTAFLGLIGKVLPMTIAGDANAPVRFVLESKWLQNSISQRNEG